RRARNAAVNATPPVRAIPPGAIRAAAARRSRPRRRPTTRWPRRSRAQNAADGGACPAQARGAASAGDDAVAALALGFVQRRVGALQQRVGALATAALDHAG